MSSTVRFLETIAQDPALARLAPAEKDALMASFGMNDEERKALLALDAEQLAHLLGARTQMAAVQFPGDDEPKRDDDEPQREDDSPADDDDGPSIRHAGALH